MCSGVLSRVGMGKRSSFSPHTRQGVQCLERHSILGRGQHMHPLPQAFRIHENVINLGRSPYWRSYLCSSTCISDGASKALRAT